MKSILKIFFCAILIIVSVYLGLAYLTGYFGYDRQNWIYRKASKTIEESIERGVFVKELHFQIDSLEVNPFKFEVFLEKAFTYGHHSIKETIPLEGSSYPFRLSFNYRPNNAIGIFIRPDQLKKFDSSNAVWGFLKYPELPDTIILEIRGENIRSGLIKVW